MADMVSERYALSLYEVAQDEKQEKLYLDQLTEVCAAFDSEPDFLKMLTTPSIAAEDKQKVLKTVFEGRIEPFLLNFLMLVTDKGRIGLIHEMCQAYKEQYYFEKRHRRGAGGHGGADECGADRQAGVARWNRLRAKR